MNTENELVRLKKEANRGWNTWNTQSVLSHVLLPHGIAVNLLLKDYSEAQVLREPLIGREGKNEETVTPGVRSWRGEYTSLNIKYGQSEFNVESTADDEDVFILVSPVKHGVKIPMLIVEECLLWGREGSLGKTDGRLWAEARGRHVEVFVTSDVDPRFQTTPTQARSRPHPRISLTGSLSYRRKNALSPRLEKSFVPRAKKTSRTVSDTATTPTITPR